MTAPAPAAAKPQPPLPCLRCGYDLTGITHAVCPECGVDTAESLRAAADHRLALFNSARNIWTNWAKLHGAAHLTCVLGVVLIGQFYNPYTRPGSEVFFDMAALFFVSLAVALSTLAFLPLLNCDPEPTPYNQRLIELVWVRHVGLLNTPWIVIPVWGLLLAAGERIMSFFGTSARSVPGLPFFLAIPWLIVAVIAFIHWMIRWNRDMRFHGLSSPTMRVIGTAVGTTVFLGALALGWAGNIFAAFTIIP